MKNELRQTLLELRPQDLLTHGVIQLAKDKKSYVCPYCDNGTGSNGTGINITFKDGVWKHHCFKCDKKGDNMHLLAKHFGLDCKNDFPTLLKLSADLFDLEYQQSDIEPPKQKKKKSAEKIITPPKQPKWQEPKKDENTGRFRKEIEHDHTKLNEFLKLHGGKFRGLTAETLNKFNCGYDAKYLYEDFPSPRLMIPNEFKAYTARYVGDKLPAGVKKVLYSPGTRYIFNLHAVKNITGPIFIVEGEIDAMSIVQAGFPAIALGGLQISKKYEEEFSQLPLKRFILLLDNDEAGIEATPKIKRIISSFGHSVKPYNLNPKYKDANEFLQSDEKKLRENLAIIYENAIEKIPAPKRYYIKPCELTQEQFEVLTEPEFTDLQNAKRLSILFENEIKFNNTRRTWFSYEGDVWVEKGKENYCVQNQVTTLIETLKQIATETKNEENNTDEANNKPSYLEKYAKSLSNCNKKNPAIETLKGLNSVQINTSEFDSIPYLLNCPNGVVNLRTKELLPHRPEYLMTLQTKANYNPNADTAFAEKFFESILPDKESRRALLLWLGYCITGETGEEKTLFIKGSGGNGKSTMTKFLSKTIGDYYCELSPELFLRSNRGTDPNSATPAFVPLVHKRFVALQELPSKQELDIGVFKKFTGNDAFNIRPLFGGTETIYDNPHKITLLANTLPELDNAGEKALKRRIFNLEFKQDFSKNPNTTLKQELSKRENIEGFLKLLVDYAAEWYERREKNHGCSGLIVSDEMSQATEDYFESQDRWAEFFAKHFIDDPAGKVSYSSFFAMYEKENQLAVLSPRTRGRYANEIINRGEYKKIKIEGAAHFKGFRWRTEADDWKEENKPEPVTIQSNVQNSQDWIEKNSVDVDEADIPPTIENTDSYSTEEIDTLAAELTKQFGTLPPEFRREIEEMRRRRDSGARS